MVSRIGKAFGGGWWLVGKPRPFPLFPIGRESERGFVCDCLQGEKFGFPGIYMCVCGGGGVGKSVEGAMKAERFTGVCVC